MNLDSFYNDMLSALREGASTDDLASGLSDALNKAKSAYEEELAQSKSKENEIIAFRKDRLEDILQNLWYLYDTYEGAGNVQEEIEQVDIDDIYELFDESASAIIALCDLASSLREAPAGDSSESSQSKPCHSASPKSSVEVKSDPIVDFLKNLGLR